MRFWPDIEERASRLTDGVQELVRQCYELSATLDNPSRPMPSMAKASMPVYGRSASCNIALKPSSFARKQVRLTREEQNIVLRLFGVARRICSSRWLAVLLLLSLGAGR